MKLIDLLVQELPKRGGFPEGANECVQDSDGTVKFFDSGSLSFSGYGWSGSARGKFYCKQEDKIMDLDLSCDHSSSIVTREQYEAALSSSEGWIDWHGGECPVDSDAIVEVKFRNPSRNKFNNDRAGDFNWSHDGFDGDIIAYRLQKPTKSEQVRDDAWCSYAGITEKDDEADLNECIGHDVDVVNHPSHYTKGNIECIDAIDSATTGKSGIEAVCVANIIKYLYRYEEKNGLEDVKKAKWYINKLISELESK